MNSSKQHITATVHWQTTFDEKEEVRTMQHTLSDWSHYKLPVLLNSVYDSVCPEDHTWKIPTLTLDLGSIDYKNLAAELSVKVEKTLREELNKIARYGANSQSEIEIFVGPSLQIELLEHFLLTGFYPWNHQTGFKTVDALFSELFETHSGAIIEMIRDIGKAERVRKRIAWQIKEENIHRIVRGLEPNHFEFIIQFTSELSTAQAQDPKGQSSKSQFKKDVWLWVLGYLLVDRGTLFNKTAFVKSSLQQMANHYNMQYEELLHWVAEAVNTAFKEGANPSELVTIIAGLSKESSMTKAKSTLKVSKEAHWRSFEQMLKMLQSSPAIINFNDLGALLLALAEWDAKRLTSIFETNRLNEKEWLVLSTNLKAPILERWTASLMRPYPNFSLATVHYLVSQSKDLHITKHEQIIRSLALQFLLNTPNARKDQESMLKFMINALATTAKTSKIQVMEILLEANSSVAEGGAQHLGAQLKLRTLLQLEYKSSKSNYFEQEFSMLLDALKKKLDHPDVPTSHMRALFSKLLKAIRLYPSAAYIFLMHYKDARFINHLLRLTLDERTAEIILQKSKSGLHAWLKQVQYVWKELQLSNASLDLIELSVMQLGARTTFEHRNASEVSIIDLCIQELYTKIPPKQLPFFFQMLKIVSASPSEVTPQKKATTIEDMAGIPRLPQEIKEIEEALGNKEVTASQFMSLLDQKDFKAIHSLWSAMTKKRQGALLHALLRGSGVLFLKFEKWFQEMDASEGTAKLEAERSYFELFWRCLRQVLLEKNNQAKLASNLELALQLRNPAAWRKFTKRDNKPTRDKAHTVTRNTFWKFIASEKPLEALESDEMKEWMQLEMELHSTDFAHRVQLDTSGRAMEVLKTVSDFQSTAAIVMGFVSSEQRQLIRSLSAGFQLTYFMDGFEEKEMGQQLFWSSLIEVLESKTRKQSVVLKPIEFVLRALAKTEPSDAVLLEVISSLERVASEKIKRGLKKLLKLFPKGNLRKETSIEPILVRAEQAHVLDELLYELLVKGSKPSWVPITNDTPKELILKILDHSPAVLYRVFVTKIITDSELEQSIHNLPFPTLIDTVTVMHPHKKTALGLVLDFYKVAAIQSGMESVGKIIQEKVISAWTQQRWNIIRPQGLINEVAWELATKYNIPKKKIYQAFAGVAPTLPMAFKIATKAFLSENDARMIKKKPQLIPSKREQEKIKRMDNNLKNGIAIHNAGLVLLSGYFPTLFDRLGLLIDQNEFKNEESRAKAVHYLQYVATGRTQTEESFLVLNKLFCEYPLGEPIIDSIEIPEEEKTLIHGLIQAAIGHWTAIGDSSLDGFRGNWLVRDGLLREEEEFWRLSVEKRPYDILIQRSPFSFSIIRFPWMKKPLHVDWAY